MLHFFFLIVPRTPELSPLSLPHPLPFWTYHPTGSTPPAPVVGVGVGDGPVGVGVGVGVGVPASTSSQISSLYRDRKSTRLNSSHANISYAVFCLKKKKKHK